MAGLYGEEARTFANVDITDTLTLSGLTPNNILTLNATSDVQGLSVPKGSVVMGQPNGPPVAGTITAGTNGTSVTNDSKGFVVDIDSKSTPTINGLNTSADIVPTQATTQNLGSALLPFNNIYGTLSPTGDFLPAADNTYSIGSALKRWLNAFYSGTINALAAIFGSLTVNGTTITQNVRPSASLTYDLGAGAFPYNNIWATGQVEGGNFYALGTSSQYQCDVARIAGGTTLANINFNAQRAITNISFPTCDGSILTTVTMPYLEQPQTWTNTNNFQALTATSINDSGTLSAVGITSLGDLTATGNTLIAGLTCNAAACSSMYDSGTLQVVGASTLAAVACTSVNCSGTMSAAATTVSDLTVSGVTSASALVTFNASKKLVTPVPVNSNGCNTSVAADGTVTFSMSQNVGTGGAPTFADVTDSGLTASRLVSCNASKKLVTPVIANSNGCNTSVAADGSVTFSMSQNVGTSGAPSFAGATLTAGLTMGTNAIASVGAITASGSISCGTNSATVGALSTTSINNSGAMTMGTNAIASVGAITSSGDIATSNTDDSTNGGAGSINTAGGIYCGKSLHFPNALASRKIVLWEDTANDNQFYGFGIQGSQLQYHVSSSGTDHIFYSGVDATHSTELCRIKGTGGINFGQSTLNYYETITTTLQTFSGCWASTPACNFRISRIGATVTIQFHDQINVATNSAGNQAVSSYTLPVSYRPTTGLVQPMWVIVANAPSAGTCVIGADGSIKTTPSTFGGYPNGSLCGFYSQCVTYNVV